MRIAQLQAEALLPYHGRGRGYMRGRGRGRGRGSNRHSACGRGASWSNGVDAHSFLARHETEYPKDVHNGRSSAAGFARGGGSQRGHKKRSAADIERREARRAARKSCKLEKTEELLQSADLKEVPPEDDGDRKGSNSDALDTNLDSQSPSKEHNSGNGDVQNKQRLASDPVSNGSSTTFFREQCWYRTCTCGCCCGENRWISDKCA